MSATGPPTYNLGYLRMVERTSPSTSSDPRARAERALEARLGALANALGRTLRDLRDRLGTVEERLADLPARTSETTADIRAVLGHLESLQRRIVEAPPEVLGRFETLDERVSSVSGEVATQIGEATASLRRSFDAMPAALAEALEPLRGLPSRVEEALQAVGEMGNRVGALEGGIARSREENDLALEGLKGSVAERVEGLSSSVSERVDDIAGRLEEAVSQLRKAFGEVGDGFQDAVSPLRAAVGEATGHLEDLAPVVGDVAERVREVEDRLTGLPERLGTALAAVVEAIGGVPSELTDAVTGIQDRVARSVSDMQNRLAEAVSGMQDGVERALAGTEQRVTQGLSGVQDRVAEVPSSVAETLAPIRDVAAELPPRIDHAMAQVREVVAAILERVAGSLAALREDVAEIGPRVADPIADLRDALAEARSASEGSLAEITRALASSGERLAEIADAALSQKDVERTVREVTDAALTRFDAEHARRSDALESGLGRVDKVADALESLERRRGVRQLLEGEQHLVEQQDALVRRVTERADLLVERMSAIEKEVGSILERVDQKQLSEEVSGRVKEAVAELRQTITTDLGTRLANGIGAISETAASRVADDVGKRVEHLREELVDEATRAGKAIVQQASETLAEELGAIREKIEAWGKSRTSPKVAEQIAAMDERVDEVARTVQEDLVDAVFDRMQRAFDRRFEVLVQLVETRIREAVGKREEPPRRRRFRRAPEED